MRLMGGLVWLVSLVVTLAAVSVRAQPDPGAAARQRMAPLQPLVGEWSGEGWMMERDGRVEFTSREVVESRLGGLVLLVEGTHESNSEPREVIHHAFGMLSWDENGETYRFRSQVADGRTGDHEAELLDEGGWRWTMEAPGIGRMRFTIRFEGDRWEEVGEYSRDGMTWRPFFEMNLDRVR